MKQRWFSTFAVVILCVLLNGEPPGGGVVEARSHIGIGISNSGGNRKNRTPCGGTLTDIHGILQTPGFPGAFPVPITCRWIIDSSNIPSSNASIAVYLTQLYVFTGLTFYEYAHYESESYKLGGRLIHTVTEQNVTHVRWLLTRRPYLVVEFKLDRLEGNHLRVLDNLLDVYGFNITYEISTLEKPVRPNSCIVVDCSFTGHCYVNKGFTRFLCACFEGFSGPNCGQGPLCHDHGRTVCQNGGVCSHVGSTAVSCHCNPGFTGDKCDVALPDPRDSECGNEGCLSQCPFDGKPEHVCNCPRGANVPTDKVRYEGTIRLSNIPLVKDATLQSTRVLENVFEKQMSKYLRNSNLSKMEELKVLNITAGAVTFHFFGGKKDSHRVRDAMNKLVERGRLGNLTLATTQIAFKQEPTLLLKSVKVNQDGYIREGDEFILSCIAQGSSYMTFRWYKDGIFVNVSKSTRDMWTQLLAPDSQDRYTAVLRIGKATPLDNGVYTCQVEEWGIQQCRSIHVEVLLPPEVKISPMSITIQKGDNVNIRCMSPNDRHHEKFGYNWAKNKNLFRMTPAKEVWEDLYPAGSILKIYNAQKSSVYTCLVHGSVSRSASVRVEVVNRTVVPLCPFDRYLETWWTETAPGVENVQSCPNGMFGTVRRLCTLRDTFIAKWELPNYASCISNDLIDIHNTFRSLTYGYQNTSGSETLTKYLEYLRLKKTLYPSEGEGMLNLVNDVMTYINVTSSTNEIPTATLTLYEIIDILLQHQNSITSQQKIIQLQQTIREQALIWSYYLKTPGMAHVIKDSLVVDIASLESQTLHNMHLPLRTTTYPSWLGDKIDIRIESMNSESFGNGSFNIVVIVYKNLSEFLPLRYVAQMSYGNDLQYEIISRIISIDLGKDGRRFSPPLGPFWVDLELPHTKKNFSEHGWNTTCGITDVATFTHTWDLDSCVTRYVSSNVTRCTCTRAGTYAVLWTHHNNLQELLKEDQGQQFFVLAGCVVCLILALITLGILLPYWWHHRSCFVFLKLQCCAAIIGAMCVFIYAMQDEVEHNMYQPISTLLQLFLLMAMSSHLSKLLIVYTEIVPIPNVRHLKQTVVGVNTGVPILTVLINIIAHQSLDLTLNSWWLVSGTLNFIIFVVSASMMTILFIFIYFSLMRKLHQLVNKHMDKTKALHKRIGLLSRGAVIFLSVILMETSSILFANFSQEIYHYIFSALSAILGIIVFICYVLRSETSLHTKIMRKLKLEDTVDENYSSESINSPLSFFTKQDGEVETDSAAPPRSGVREIRGVAVGHAGGDPTEGLLLAESRSQRFYRYPHSEPPSSTIETYVHSVEGSQEKYSDLDIQDQHRLDEQNDVDLERYQSSPKKYKNVQPMPMSGYGMYPEYVLDSNLIQNYPVDYNVRHYYPEGHSDMSAVRPSSGKCFIQSPEMLTTRVCVELGLVKSSQHNSEIVGAEANISVEAPPNVMCSVDVEPLREVECVSIPVCNGKEKMKIAEHDDSSKPETTTTTTSEPVIPKIDIIDFSNNDSSGSERKQPDGREKSNKETPTDGEDNLDGMLDRISHDLDYLLNRTLMPEQTDNFNPHAGVSTLTRKTSKPPANSVRSQIREEDEEAETTATVDESEDVAKTAC